MTVTTESIKLQTRAGAEIIDITSETQDAVNRSGLKNGVVTLFVPGSTAALTTIEYEEGALSDFRRLFDEIASSNRQYAHNARWGDGNGHSHVRAALLGPSLAVPFVDGRLTLGTWQQIVFIDFDNQPRVRTLIAQIMGE